MKMPSWLTRQADTTADYASRVEDAQRDLAALNDAKSVAQRAYDVAPSKQTEDALLDADEALKRGQLRLDSATRALNAAKQAEAEKQRGSLLARKASLEAQLDPSALEEMREPGIAAEAKALLDAVAVHTRRVELEVSFNNLRGELRRVCDQLGEPAPLVGTNDPYGPYSLGVQRALWAHIRGISPDDNARPFAMLLLDALGGIPFERPAPPSFTATLPETPAPAPMLRRVAR